MPYGDSEEEMDSINEHIKDAFTAYVLGARSEAGDPGIPLDTLRREFIVHVIKTIDKLTEGL